MTLEELLDKLNDLQKEKSVIFSQYDKEEYERDLRDFWIEVETFFKDSPPNWSDLEEITLPFTEITFSESRFKTWMENEFQIPKDDHYEHYELAHPDDFVDDQYTSKAFYLLLDYRLSEELYKHKHYDLLEQFVDMNAGNLENYTRCECGKWIDLSNDGDYKLYKIFDGWILCYECLAKDPGMYVQEMLNNEYSDDQGSLKEFDPSAQGFVNVTRDELPDVYMDRNDSPSSLMGRLIEQYPELNFMIYDEGQSFDPYGYLKVWVHYKGLGDALTEIIDQATTANTIEDLPENLRDLRHELLSNPNNNDKEFTNDLVRKELPR